MMTLHNGYNLGTPNASSVEHLSRAPQQLCIEVVSSDPASLRQTIARLRTAGFELSVVLRDSEAAARACVIEPALVLLQASAPFARVLQICSQLKGDQQTRNVPVLVLLEPQNKDLRRSFLIAGAIDCVAVGDDPEEVLLRVETLFLTQGQDKQMLANAEQDCADHYWLKALKRFLMSRVGQNLSMQDLEHQFQMSRRRLNHRFEQATGMTAFAWWNEQKLTYARSLLLHSDMQVEELASILGYGRTCNFSTAFRHRFGVSPSKYRKQQRIQRISSNERSL